MLENLPSDENVEIICDPGKQWIAGVIEEKVLVIKWKHFSNDTLILESVKKQLDEKGNNTLFRFKLILFLREKPC